jgi:hypothetical protein
MSEGSTNLARHASQRWRAFPCFSSGALKDCAKSKSDEGAMRRCGGRDAALDPLTHLPQIAERRLDHGHASRGRRDAPVISGQLSTPNRVRCSSDGAPQIARADADSCGKRPRVHVIVFVGRQRGRKKGRRLVMPFQPVEAASQRTKRLDLHDRVARDVCGGNSSS